MESCGSRLQKCVIYADQYKIEDHQYGMARCQKRKEKICVHITSKYTNCIKAHVANFPHCISRDKVDISVRKKKTKKIQKKKEPLSNIDNKIGKEERKTSPQLDINMKLKEKNWALSPILASKYEIDKSPDEIFEGRDYIKDF